MRRLRFICLAALAALALVACSNTSGPTPTLTISPTSATVTAGGKSVSFTATLKSGAGTVKWTLSPASGAGTISPTSGTTTTYTPPASASSQTTATLTASAGSLTARATLTIKPGTTVPMTYTIDPSITPSPDSLPGSRPLAAVQDADGATSTFVANEVIIAPKSKAELDAFLSRHGGTIIETNAAPPPPASLHITLDPSETEPTAYAVQLDPNSFALDDFAADARKVGIGGSFKISSDAAARLLALTTHEAASGLAVTVNFVQHSTESMLFKTEERPKPGGGYKNAFDTQAYQPTGSRANVLGAWQFVAAHGIVRRVRVAIIDGGFWLDSSGHPMAGPGGSDLPYNIPQYSFNDDSYFAGGPNPMSCTGGSSCPWHGNGSAGVAVGIANNHAGEAGTGGTVAAPMLFKVDSTLFTEYAAVRTAAAWGADVISMSFGGGCEYWCRQATRLLELAQGGDPYDYAHDHGAVLVAAAGNDGRPVDDAPGYVHPCYEPHVICVGALNDGANTAKGYSNYGSRVNIWAPTDIPVMANPSNPTPIHNGTSASTPFVAGVAAMMKAVNPALTPDQIGDILSSTAWTNSSDPKVTAYINALAAVKKAANYQLPPPDYLEPNDSSGTSATLSPGEYDNLKLDTLDYLDYYNFTLSDYAKVGINLVYMPYLGQPLFNVTPPKSVGAPSGVTDTLDPTGRSYAAGLMAPGTYHIVLSGLPTLYNLGLQVTYTGLQPDQFEPDDTLATAASPDTGGDYQVNLHLATDVDYYYFDTTGATLPMDFDVELSDQPLTLTLYDSSGSVVNTSPTSQTPSLLIPGSGQYTVEVQGSQSARYIFFAGVHFTDPSLTHHFGDAKWFRTINVGDPLSCWLVGPEEYYVFTRSSDRMQALHLSGAGLHLTLFDAQGNVLQEGESNSDPAQPGERLSLADTVNGSTYVVSVSRTTDNRSADGQPVVLPAVQYGIAFGQ